MCVTTGGRSALKDTGLPVWRRPSMIWAVPEWIDCDQAR